MMSAEVIKRHPLPGQILMAVPHMDDYKDTDEDAPHHEEDRSVTNDLDEATVMTSIVERKLGKGIHKPVIDVDFPVVAVPSSTPGHSHLIIDKELTWEQYEKLLTVMVEVGLVEPGYLGASRERGHTAVRLPWVRKPRVDSFPW